MKSLFRASLSLLLALVLAAAPLTAYASVALGDDLLSDFVEIHRQTQLHTGTFWSNSSSDLRQENYVVYSPNSAVKPIVTNGGYATQLTTVSAAASELESRGYRVVAGINGDYYDTVTGVPLGCVISEGTLHSVTKANYAIGFYEDGSAVMGAPNLTMSAFVADNNTEFTVSALNYVRQTTYGIFLYDSTFNARSSTGTNEPGVDVICSVVGGQLSIGGALTLRVEQVLPNATDTVLREGQYVLSANLRADASYTATLLALQPGSTITISTRAESDVWNGVTNMIGALYPLVQNSTVCTGLPTGAAPRTAVGLRADGSLVLYTIDGRQSGYSIGASLTQVAERLVELGCVSAMSLDGGGSTTMVATMPDATVSSVENLPSGGSSRAVTNHLFLVASAQPSGALDHIYLTTEASNVLPNATVKLSAAAVDTNHIPMSANITYSADRGSVSGDVLTAPASGTVTVTARSGGVSASKTLQVVSRVDSIAVLRDGKAVPSLTLSRGDVVTLSAKAIYQHLGVLGDNHGFIWSVTGGVGSVDENGVFTAAGRISTGSVNVSLGAVSVSIPVSISSDPLRTLDNFEEAFASYTGVNAMLSHNTAEAYVARGSASAKLEYAITQTSGAQIGLSYPVRNGYDRVNLWAYGDGNGAALTLDTDAGSVPVGALTFTGWQQLSAMLPVGTSRLISLSLSAPADLISTLYFDQLVLSYENVVDTTAPVISLSYQADGNAVSGTVADDCDGTALSSLRVTYDGAVLQHTFDANGNLKFSLPALDGAQHRVTVIAGDASGNLTRKSLDVVATDGLSAFADTADHWANSAISYLKRAGISNGDENGNFNPDANISRQEFALLLCRYLAPTQDFSSVSLPFADSASISAWAMGGVKAMYALGVTKGSINLDGSLTFNPTATISRQEAVTMIGRLLEKGYASPALSFRDKSSIADWAAGYISTLNAMGILTGDTDGRFYPGRYMTRAQVATVLYKLR